MTCITWLTCITCITSITPESRGNVPVNWMNLSLKSCFLFWISFLAPGCADTCINLTRWTWENLIWGYSPGTRGGETLEKM